MARARGPSGAPRIKSTADNGRAWQAPGPSATVERRHPDHRGNGVTAIDIWLETQCEIAFDDGMNAPMVLVLRPQSNAHQWVAENRFHLDPVVIVNEYVDPYGNRGQRLTAPSGPFRIRTGSAVLTAGAADRAPGTPFTLIQDLPAEVLTYLLPSRYCESDRMGPDAQRIVADARPGYDQVARIVEWVRQEVAYVPGSSNTLVSALEVKARGAGVCRDLTHLAISLCRSISIPARMVVGYLEGLEPMDLHAWFEAFVGGRWYTFDPTQRDLGGGRVMLALGRDAADVPVFNQFGPPVVPRYIEVSVERTGERG